MTVPVITWDPPIPQRPTDSRAEFNANATAFVASLPVLKAQINNANQWANNQFTETSNLLSYTMDFAADSITEMQQIKSDTILIKSETEMARDQAISSSNFAGVWVELSGPLSRNSSVYHDDRFWMLNVNLANVSSSEPSEQSSDWILIGAQAKRKILTTDQSLSIGGRYFIVGSINVTISSEKAGEEFEFTSAIGSNPKIYGNITTALFGDVDYVELDNQLTYQFIYNNLNQKLEV